MDPTDAEETFCCTKSVSDTTLEHGIIVQAALPQHDQISEMYMVGSIEVDTITNFMDILNETHKNICLLMEQCLVKTVFKTFRPSDKRTDKK